MNAPKPPHQPCPSCPWRMDQDAQDIPHFSLALAERLAATCPDHRGRGPDFGAPMFACHQSKVGAEVHCAGWLASVGHAHPAVRLGIVSGRLDAARLAPGPGWPALHDNYAQVLDKLRSTAGACALDPDDSRS
ncbi:MAG: hypothetical protein JSR41_02135 [Proteobacteria bacterium]|nr:hypothetical protein [Pseudomonadota bacterium]